MMVRTQRKPVFTKTAYSAELQSLLDKKIAKAAFPEHQESDRVARVDEARKSQRGHRGGNFGNSN